MSNNLRLSEPLSIFEGMGLGGGRALAGALASGGFTLKIFLYNKLPT